MTLAIVGRKPNFSYNGKQVRITGTVKKASGSSSSSPAEPRTLKVSDIKGV
jgi:hypothetical protein